MTLTLQLTNKDLEGSLAVTVNGETKKLTRRDNRINFELSDAKEATVRARYVRSDAKRIKNPIAGFFAYLFSLLLSTIIFYADNDNGIGVHKFFYGAKPFDWEKLFKIKPTENVVSLRYVPPKYHKEAKAFSAPDLELAGAEITEEAIAVEYNPVAMRKEFRLYHYPAYTILFAVNVALTALMAICLFNQLIPFNAIGAIAMSLCCLVVLVLLIAFVCAFASTHRLFNEIDQGLRKQKYNKINL